MPLDGGSLLTFWQLILSDAVSICGRLPRRFTRDYFVTLSTTVPKRVVFGNVVLPSSLVAYARRTPFLAELPNRVIDNLLAQEPVQIAGNRGQLTIWLKAS